MPGKQMSIDADLNAGIITEEDARNRRRSLEREADFYGSMDGAIRFVRGDAIAGILITLINVIGGFAIGVFQQGMAVSEAARVYTLLTIGDGLVTQLPALVVSTAVSVYQFLKSPLAQAEGEIAATFILHLSPAAGTP